MSTGNYTGKPAIVNYYSGGGVPESVYRRHVLRARSTRNHFTFTRDYVDLIPSKKLGGERYTDSTRRDVVLFLQDVINRASMPKARRVVVTEPDDDGNEVEREYVQCTVKYLRTGPMRWSSETQKAYLELLARLGYVRYRRMGVPGKRHVWVDLLKLETDLDGAAEPPSGGKNPLTSRGETQWGEKPPHWSGEKPPQNKGTPNGVPKEGKKGAAGKAGRPSPPPVKSLPFSGKPAPGKPKRRLDEPPPPCYGWEKELRRILREHNVRITKWTREGGAQSFRKLRRWSGDDDGRINVLLTVYDKDFDTPGLPTVTSVHDFCKPRIFTWIEDRLVKAKARKDRNGHATDDVAYIREHYGEYPRGPILDKIPHDPPDWFYVRTEYGIDKYDGRNQMDGPIQQNRLEEM